MTNWRNCTNKCTETQKIRDISGYVRASEEDNIYNSAIDRFYKTANEVIRMGNSIEVLENNSIIGGLFYIAIISATENYFREIMADIIAICPIAKGKAANQGISLGSVIWHGQGRLEKGAFENSSFADVDALKKAVKNYLDIDVSKVVAIADAFDEYSKLCQLRHAIVHSNRIIAGKNAIQLNINPSDYEMQVHIKYRHLQECISVCMSLVEAFNQELYQQLCTRWATRWNKLPSYNPSTYNQLFAQVWKIFFSKYDRDNGDTEDISMIKCRNAIKKEFNM